MLAERASAVVHYKDCTDKQYAIELDIGVLYKLDLTVTYNYEESLLKETTQKAIQLVLFILSYTIVPLCLE